MDWKKTFNRGQWFIHSIFVIAILIATGATLFALRLNHLQSTEEERGLKINSLIHYLKNDMSFEKTGKLLSWAESDKANDKMRDLGKKIAETEELLEVQASKDLGLGLRTFHKLINNTTGMSDPTDALKVLRQKVAGLSDVAKANKFKNIETITERMDNRLADLNARNVGSNNQVGNLEADIKRLEQAVANSSLSDSDKASLTARFASMSNELNLLASLSNQSKDLKAHITQASLALSGWLVDVEKKARDLQGMRFQKHNKLIQLLAGMVGFLVLAWLGLAYLFRWQKGRIGEQVETEVKGVIQNGILGDQRFMVDHYSEQTKNDIIKLLDDIKIKLNLGSMLHTGLPFAGCLIDNNFKLTWHNHLFLEQFYLSEEEVRSDAFNWDYLRDYLNLDEDPVYQALVNKIAGIYPVKLKQDELAPSQPYEMYVTPIMVNREDRVMVFFYPLVSAREAINEQVNLARQTLTRFINLWREEKLDDEQLKFLEKDFRSNNLTDLYQDLIVLYQSLNGELTESYSAIRSLEKENQSFQESLEEVSQLQEEKKEIIKQEFQLANSLKDSFLSALERVESLMHINKSILMQNDDLRTDAVKIQQINHSLIKKNKETVETMTQLDAVKADYKKLKFELLEVKARLISQNNSLFGQLPALDEAQQKLASRYKDELAKLDVTVSTFEKKLAQLDMLLGKLNVMNEKAPTEQTNFSFQSSQREQELKLALETIQSAQGREENIIIESFKSLHGLMRKDLGKSNDAREISKTSLDSFLS
ncbi:MAG TPA: hypothetical protein VNJ01_17145 [Bacteriovoracaceae bacterium]|nr:hypothetical protein [Bacteriovoracaceae bacterium]